MELFSARSQRGRVDTICAHADTKPRRQTKILSAHPTPTTTASVYNFAVAMEVKMTHQFDVIVEKDSAGYFVASVPALPGCHTQAKSLDTLMERIREAMQLCLAGQDASSTSLYH